MTGTETQNWFEPVSFLYFSVNYKNICLHYTFAILHSYWSVVVCYLSGEKSSFYGSIFVRFSFPTNNMGKVKTAYPEPRRTSIRLAAAAAAKPKPPLAEIKKRPAVKKAPKPKKAKQTENGNPKAEESKAEATEAK